MPRDAGRKLTDGSRLYSEFASRIELLFPAILDVGTAVPNGRPIFGTLAAGSREIIKREGDAIQFVYVSPGTDAMNGGEFPAPFFRLRKNSNVLTDWIPCMWYANAYDFAAAAITPGVNQIALPAVFPCYQLSFTEVELWNPRATPVNLQAVITFGAAKVMT